LSGGGIPIRFGGVEAPEGADRNCPARAPCFHAVGKHTDGARALPIYYSPPGPRNGTVARSACKRGDTPIELTKGTFLKKLDNGRPLP